MAWRRPTEDIGNPNTPLEPAKLHNFVQPLPFHCSPARQSRGLPGCSAVRNSNAVDALLYPIMSRAFALAFPHNNAQGMGATAGMMPTISPVSISGISPVGVSKFVSPLLSKLVDVDKGRASTAPTATLSVNGAGLRWRRHAKDEKHHDSSRRRKNFCRARPWAHRQSGAAFAEAARVSSATPVTEAATLAVSTRFGILRSALPPLAWLSTPWWQRLTESTAPFEGLAMVTSRSAWRNQDALRGLIRSEALLTGVILLAAPWLLRSWAIVEAKHHDTLECRTVLQTYLIAAGGWFCALCAAVAGNVYSAVVLQAVWRISAARSLWTWSDIGRRLNRTPGWLHASVSRWRITATYVAVVGAALRVLLLLSAGRNARAVAAALASPMVDFLPRWVVRMASTADDDLRLSSSQICFGLGIYVWVSYYMCVFMPYRVLYDEYQNFSRRNAQFWKDLTNGQENDYVLKTKLGPPFPRHIVKRMSQMPAGNERDMLHLLGIVRHRSCSMTVAQAAMMKKNKQGKWGVKMTPLKPGDLRFWGSDVFDRFEQQERRDKETGWIPPVAPNTGRFKHQFMIYSRIMREIRVELGKSVEEMESDPVLSPQNLMRFDPDAEEGDFDLIMQEKAKDVDAVRDNTYMKSDKHEMVMLTHDTAGENAKEAGVPVDLDKMWLEDYQYNAEGKLTLKDKFEYKKDNAAGRALEDSIQSRSPSEPSPTPEEDSDRDLEQKGSGTDATPSIADTNATSTE